MATPTEMARQAQTDVSLLRREFELFVESHSKLELMKLREVNAILEEKVAKLEKVAEDATQLPVILDRLNKLEEDKRESYKRVWQFFFLLGGVVLGVIGNLIVSALKSNGGAGQPK